MASTTATPDNSADPESDVDDRTRVGDDHEAWLTAYKQVKSISQALTRSGDVDVDTDGLDFDINSLEKAQIRSLNPNKLLAYNIPRCTELGMTTASLAMKSLLTQSAGIDAKLFVIETVYLCDDAVFITPSSIPASEFPLPLAKFMAAIKRCLSQAIKVIWAPYLDKDGLRSISIDTRSIHDTTSMEKLTTTIIDKLTERNVAVVRTWTAPLAERIVIYLYHREDLSNGAKMAPITAEGMTLILRTPNLRSIIMPCAAYHLVICVPPGKVSRVGTSLKNYMLDTFEGCTKFWLDRPNDRVHIIMDTMENATRLQDEWDYEQDPQVPASLRRTELIGPHFAAHCNALPWTAKKFEDLAGTSDEGARLRKLVEARDALSIEIKDCRVTSKQMTADYKLNISATLQRMLAHHTETTNKRLEILERQQAKVAATTAEILMLLKDLTGINDSKTITFQGDSAHERA